MSCLVQVLDPDPAEAAVIGTALGVRGDVCYDEYGSQPLTVGQVEIDILFLYEKATADYVLEYGYVENLTDENPFDIRVVVIDRTTLGFKVLLSAAPEGDAADYTFKWHVITPDPLIRSQILTAGPRYVLATTNEAGLTALINGSDQVQVEFLNTKANNNWSFVVLTILNLLDALPMVFSYTVTSKTTLGFSIQLSGQPDNDNYYLQWEVKE
jgi:hypothetical protein